MSGVISDTTYYRWVNRCECNVMVVAGPSGRYTGKSLTGWFQHRGTDLQQRLQNSQADIDDRPREGRRSNAKDLRRCSPSIRNGHECQPRDDDEEPRQRHKAEEEDRETEGNAYGDHAQKAHEESLVGHGGGLDGPRRAASSPPAWMFVTALFYPSRREGGMCP